jgi:hypothetical protein
MQQSILVANEVQDASLARVSMLTETGPRMCVEKGPLRRGLEGLSNDIRNWSELGPLRHEELAPLLS